jgi:hypothetical protein
MMYDPDRAVARSKAFFVSTLERSRCSQEDHFLRLEAVEDFLREASGVAGG